MLTNSEKGAKGGRSKSERKRAAARANLRKARVHRYPGREQAAEQTELAREHHIEDTALVAKLNSELGLEPGRKRALFNVAFTSEEPDAQ